MNSEQEISDQIAARLKALRIFRRRDVGDVANEMGITPNKYSRLENGSSTMTAPELVLASRALGVAVSNIAGDIPLKTEGGDNV